MPDILYSFYSYFSQIRRPFFGCVTRFSLLISTVVFVGSGVHAEEKSQLELWRLDCGTMNIDDISYFSDTFSYEGQSAFITNGCYLVRNGDKYLLWEAGLPEEVLNNTVSEDGWTETISITIADQLSTLGLKPEDIDYLGVSHWHGDHIGQADTFRSSTLLMNKADVNWIRENPPGNARRRLSAWFGGDAPLMDFKGDHDVFGDGTVTILATPGHTPGHSSLLIRLPKHGPVLLTGDLFHFRREIGLRNVSRWNHSRADTLASIERFNAIVGTINPTVIVQHDLQDINHLPTFPNSAK